ncbi:MAG: protein BatD [Acidobacteria bacterium]|nr:protein BatD [Acidobacteriota bacterium]
MLQPTCKIAAKSQTVVAGLDAVGLLLAGFSQLVGNFSLSVSEKALAAGNALRVTVAEAGFPSAIGTLPDRAFRIGTFACLLHCHGWFLFSLLSG